LRAAIRPYLRSPEETVQVRCHCINQTTPQPVLDYSGTEQPAPPELAQPLTAFHTVLKQNRVPYTFLTYTTYHLESKGWQDKFEFS
jgi:hypothetical protein